MNRLSYVNFHPKTILDLQIVINFPCVNGLQPMLLSGLIQKNPLPNSERRCIYPMQVVAISFTRITIKDKI